jgi:dihydroxyacetone kinase-like predicted kinase
VGAFPLLLQSAASGGMATTPLGLILTQGPLGIVAGLFIWLFMRQLALNKIESTAHDAEIKALNETIKTERENQYKTLDGVREAQIAREREVAQTLKEYGQSVVIAVDQTAIIAQELRRSRGEEQ